MPSDHSAEGRGEENDSLEYCQIDDGQPLAHDGDSTPAVPVVIPWAVVVAGVLIVLGIFAGVVSGVL